MLEGDRNETDSGETRFNEFYESVMMKQIFVKSICVESRALGRDPCDGICMDETIGPDAAGTAELALCK